MADIEKQLSLPTRKSSLDGTTCDVSPRNSTLQPEAPLIPSTDDGKNSRTRAWLAVFGGFLALFCSFGQLTAFGTFQSWYSTHQLVSHSLFSISWIGSLQLWTFFVTGAPIGYLFDTYGPTPLLWAGSCILAISLVATSLSVQYYHYLLAQGILFGLGVALLFYPSISCVATHFNEYRATAIGIVTAGSSCGGVVYPIMLRYLFRVVGFGWAVRISALLAAALCLLAISTVKFQQPVKKKAGAVVSLQTFMDGRFLLLVLGSFFVCLGIFVPYFYISDYAEFLHIPHSYAFYALSAMNAGGVLGRVAPAWLSDKIGRFNLLCPAAFLSGLSCLVFWMLSKDIVSIMVFAALYGFLSGALISIVSPCVAQISETQELGTRIGALYTLVSVPTLFGGPIAGVLLQRYETYTASIALSGSSIVLGSIFLLISRCMINSKFLCRV